MNELDHKALLKILFAVKTMAILLLICGIYVFGYLFFRETINLTSSELDFFFTRINNIFGFFNNRIYYHIAIFFLLLISYLPTDADARVQVGKKTIIILLITGCICFFFPFVNSCLYIILTSYGFFAILLGCLYIHTGISVKKNKDEFNNIQQSFSQFEKLIETEDSINLPTTYYLKDNNDVLKKHRGWINIINPFRAVLVMGTPGSGKSYCFINPAIEQLLLKRFAMYLYDFKYPTLSVLAYNHFHWAKEKTINDVSSLEQSNSEIPQELLSYSNAQAYVLNFDSPAFSHRANPLNSKLIKSDTDAKDAAETIMLALNPDSRKNRDFFVLSGINLVQSLIMYLKQYRNGRFCTFAHLVELLNVELDELFPMLMSVRSLEGLVKAFADAFKEGAMDQLQGQVASAKMPLVAIAGENLWWVCSGEDFELDVNDPLEPKLVCIGNNPEKKETYAPLLALYTNQFIKQINKQNKHRSSVCIDELPTMYVNGLDNLIATARSNKVAVILGIQDNSQLEVGYGKERSTALINTIGNFASGQVQGDTAKFVSNLFGKNLQKSTSHSFAADGTLSKSVNEVRDLIIPENAVSNLTQGFFVGRVADDFDNPIDKKLFHCKVDIDNDKIKQDTKKFVDIPIFTYFDKASANSEYIKEFLNEFTSLFEGNREVVTMMEELMRLSDSECIYELQESHFSFFTESLSHSTRTIIKTKLNYHGSLKQELFDDKIRKRLISFYIKQLIDYDFIQPMGKYNGNKNRYYVTIWMKAKVRENYYQIKDDIINIKNEVIEELLKDPNKQSLFRPEYLEARLKQKEEEIENQYGNDEPENLKEEENNESIFPDDFYDDSGEDSTAF